MEHALWYVCSLLYLGFGRSCWWLTQHSLSQDGITVPSTGAAQMQHFKKDDGMNIFRLPVGWQYLTNNVVGGDLDSTNFGKYDELMQSCLDLGVKVRIFMIE